MTAKAQAYTCYVSGCNEPSEGIGHSCETHKAEFRAQWKAEHTRKGPGDKRKGWLIGDVCRVKIGGVEYEGKILDMTDRTDGDYLLTQLELTKTVQGLGNEITKTWTHPKPVQTYKLRKWY